MAYRVSSRLSFLDRYLTAWIFSAMAIGVVAGWLMPGIVPFLNKFSVGTTSIPIAVGLILMMYPPLAKVRYEELGRGLPQHAHPGAFARAELGHRPAPDVRAGDRVPARTSPSTCLGLILIGLARCIAMVIVWNDLAKGDTEYAAGLVAFNSSFQVLFYSVYAWVFVTVLPPLFGLHGTWTVNITMGADRQERLHLPGHPLPRGHADPLRARSGEGPGVVRDAASSRAISPLTLVALLFTIVVMFSLKGEIHRPAPSGCGAHRRPAVDLLRGDVPGVVLHGAEARAPTTRRPTTLSFTAACNNFELAIAVAVAVSASTRGPHSRRSSARWSKFRCMIALVNVSFFFQRRYFKESLGTLSAMNSSESVVNET